MITVMRDKKIFYTISIVLIAMFLFSQLAPASEIEIKPVVEGENYYIMQLNQTQTFTAYGFGWDSDTQQKIPDIEIKEIHWTFDSRFLELVQSKDNTITLKAIKDRTSRLTVTGKIDGETVTKTIFIVIERK